jgi:hypothetical protein
VKFMLVNQVPDLFEILSNGQFDTKPAWLLLVNFADIQGRKYGEFLHGKIKNQRYAETCISEIPLSGVLFAGNIQYPEINIKRAAVPFLGSVTPGLILERDFLLLVILPHISRLSRACIVLVSCLKTESLSFSEHNADVCVEKQMFWRDKCHQGHFMNIVFSCCAGFNGCDIGIVPSIVKTHGEFGI